MSRTVPRVAALVVLLSSPVALMSAPPARYATLAEASPVLESFAASLPAGAADAYTRRDAGRWLDWMYARDLEIRARLAQGDQDTLINWLMFGTTFTSQPRAALVASTLGSADAMRQLGAVINGRIDDLIAAMQSPGADERRLFARAFFQGNGFDPATPQGAAELRGHIVRAIQRIASDDEQRRLEIERLQAAGNRADALALSQRMFWNRGLSLDTSLAPNFAIERVLEAQRDARRLAGPIRRVAIIGPGLDFADKNAGFDAYPIQTVQPFAVVDGLRRLGLAAPDLEVTTLDISPRILQHISRARDSGTEYTIQLPLSRGLEWTAEFREYWMRFGNAIGKPVPMIDERLAALAEHRAIRVGPDLVSRIRPIDLNVVTERLDERFDLVIATNVFLYYDGLDQALALANVAAMLPPGGWLISNTILPEVEALPLRLEDLRTVPYTAGQDADVMLAYRRIAE